MARTITVDGTNITALARLAEFAFEMKAHAGEVAAGSAVFDDTTGSADPASPLKEWKVEESEATPTTIAGGFIGERRPDRGPLTVGTQRQWTPALEDWNTVLSDRVLKGTNARRPEETDVERIQWLVDTGALGMLDGADIDTDEPEDMEKTSYRGKYPFDVLNDCAENSGKNYYVRWKEGTGWVLFYGPWNQTGADYTSGIQISDDLSDIDNASIFGAKDIEYELDPGRIYSHLFIKWRKGWVTVSNDQTADDYRNKQKTVIRENFRTAARARRWGEKQLVKLDEPVKRLSLSLTVPASVLGDLRAGQRIQVKLAARGITAFTYFRIVTTVFTATIGEGGQPSDVLYDVRLTMRDKIRAVNLGDIYGDPETTIGNGGSGSGESGQNSDGSSEVGQVAPGAEYLDVVSDNDVGPDTTFTIPYPDLTSYTSDIEAGFMQVAAYIQPLDGEDLTATPDGWVEHRNELVAGGTHPMRGIVLSHRLDESDTAGVSGRFRLTMPDSGVTDITYDTELDPPFTLEDVPFDVTRADLEEALIEGVYPPVGGGPDDYFTVTGDDGGPFIVLFRDQYADQVVSLTATNATVEELEAGRGIGFVVEFESSTEIAYVVALVRGGDDATHFGGVDGDPDEVSWDGDGEATILPYLFDKEGSGTGSDDPLGYSGIADEIWAHRLRVAERTIEPSPQDPGDWFQFGTFGEGFSGSLVFAPTTPTPGTVIIDYLVDVADGILDTFTLPTPFVAGSLSTKVAGLTVIPQSTDPDSGSFTFDDVPSEGSRIVASWTVA